MAKSKNPDDGVSTWCFYFDVVPFIGRIDVVGVDGVVGPGFCAADGERKGRKEKVNENKRIILVYFCFYFPLLFSFSLCIPRLPLHLVLFRFLLARDAMSASQERCFGSIGLPTG